MSPNQSTNYGSIASPPRPSKSEDGQPISGSGNHKIEVQAGRLSRLMLLALATVVIGAFVANRNFAGVRKSKHRRNFWLDKDFDESELFFDRQAVDHLDADNEEKYSQRFYKISENWEGPGYPILVIMGGEDSLDLPMLYPYVYKGLAKEFQAFVLSPEHRFYGKSQPVKYATNQELVKYLSPDQALLDAISLIQYTRESIGCSLKKTSSDYCPVITFGGSYPGFLSAMLRFRFPDIVDISYAASAPLNVHAQTVDPEAYFDKITEVTETAVSGCADAVRNIMYAAREELLTHFTSVAEAAKATGFCTSDFPAYMQEIPDFISETITYLIPAVFADFNMGYYPPGPDRALERACHIFKDPDHAPLKKISLFYDLRGEIEYGLEKKPDCFDLSLELPDGPNATIRSADSSGSGGGFTGEIWEFQCCKDLVPRAAYSDTSMFIARPYSFKWLKRHCKDRFEGIPVDPFRMVRAWQFDDLSKASRILFTNGLRDGWSTGSILKSSNPNITIINLPNGAHHSDLTQKYPDEEDTEDVIQGHKEAKEILRRWLEEIKAENNTNE